jgi:tRNA A-37 threonylcarbamoyl transferase component Bud32
VTRLPNPFIYGKPVSPEYFVGREEEVTACFNALAGPVRGSIAISGEPRFGKTSLLTYVAQIGPAEGWGQPHTRTHFVFLDCQSISRFSPTRFWHRVLDLLAHRVDNPPLQEKVAQLLAKEDIDSAHFEDVLEVLHATGESLVLLLDEFEWVVKKDAKTLSDTCDFLSGLRALINVTPNVLSLVTATRLPLNVLCQGIIADEGSPFYNNFVFRHLQPFRSHEVNQLIERALTGTDIAFDEQDRAYISQIAGTHPFLVQVAGSLLFEAKSQNLHTADGDRFIVTRCIADGYRAIGTRFEEEARHHFSQLWDFSSPEERTLLLLVAWQEYAEEWGSNLSLDWEIYDRLLRRCERDLIRLAERGLVVNVETTPHIFSSVFAWWLMNEIRRGSEEDLQRQITGLTYLPPSEVEKVTQIIRRVREEGSRLTWNRLSALTPEDARNRPFIAEPTSPRNMPPQTRRQLGRYRIIEELGRGAMGVVYMAHDPNVDRLVALKVMRPDLSWVGDEYAEEFRERFRREAHAAGRLIHPNIVVVYDADQAEDKSFIVMEYLEGITLDKVVEKEGALIPRRAVKIVRQVCGALDYAHSEGIIHRDIKPANIMLLGNDYVKVTDFGLVKPKYSPRITEPGRQMGTPAFMSPEQVRGQEVDHRSDIFSVGAVAYYALTGKLPFPGDQITSVMRRVVEEDPPPLRQCGHLRSPDLLQAILFKAMAKKQEDRFQTCIELADALDAWCDGS